MIVFYLFYIYQRGPAETPAEQNVDHWVRRPTTTASAEGTRVNEATPAEEGRGVPRRPSRKTQ